jgi:Zn-dependent M32 family carboxypeptidase
MKQLKRSLVSASVMTALILTFALVFTPARAEEKKDGATTNMEILQEKIRADKKLVVAANMNLTEAEAKAFWPLYQEYQTNLSKINERIAKIIGEYAGNYNSMTNEVAKKLMKESVAVEKERVALKESMMPKFEKALPAIKAARYYQIENKIQAAVQYELADQIPLVE